MKKSKHQNIVDSLESRLRKKGNADRIFKNVVYDRGEMDLVVLYNTRGLIIEVKSNDSDKAYMTAVKQLRRATRYMNKTHPNKRFYSLYYTPQKYELQKW